MDKFEYARLLAWQFPGMDYDECNDTFVEVPHITFDPLERFPEDFVAKLSVTEESFYKQERIIAPLEAYNLDKEKFWYAVAYVFSLTRQWSELRGLNRLPKASDQLTTMRNEIKGRREFKIVIDNDTESHSFIIAGKRLIEVMVMSLDRMIAKEKKSDWANSYEIPLWRLGTRKKTEMTWYAAKMFKLLLDCLKLPVKRARSKNGKDSGSTYDKNQLIAELIHFLDLTDNPDLDGNSIKAILKSKREFGIGII